MCDQDCRFTLTSEDGLQVCKNNCELDNDSVECQVSELDYDEMDPGTDMHEVTHLCEVHNRLRQIRHFGYRMSKEFTACMEFTTTAPWWLKPA